MILFLVVCHKFYLNYRHLALLSDLMTNKGQLIAINKFRVNEENFQLIITDLLLKKLLIFNRNSCIFSTRVNENIILGNLPKI